MQYIGPNEIMDAMGIKQAKAYEVIRQLNAELKEKGVYTVSGRVLKSYFEERTQCKIDTKKDAS